MRQPWSGIVIGLALGGMAGGLAGVALAPGPEPEPAGPPVLPTAEGTNAPKAAQDAPTVALMAGTEPAPDVPATASVEVAQARPEDAAAAWVRTDAEVARLRLRVADLERRLAAVQGQPAVDPAGQRPLAATADGRRSALVEAGLPEDAAAELVRRQGQQSLDRLNLRDLAAREGWLGTDRYREELARIEADAVVLRDELGDEVYDRYLYAAGEDNRVQVDGIIGGSVAELAGLQPGDLIESYAGDRVFTYSDLRDATAAGERGELVPVRVLRAGQPLDAWVPRGPLGVELDTARTTPW